MMQTYPFAVSSDGIQKQAGSSTGGTKGMGEAVVRRFLLSGAGVVTTARSPFHRDKTHPCSCNRHRTADGVKEGCPTAIQQEWHGLDILCELLGDRRLRMVDSGHLRTTIGKELSM